jgi:galactonate dehydratase
VLTFSSAGKRLGVPIWQLLGGKVRDRCKVYGWIGGDKPNDVVAGAKARLEQGFTAVKMNGTGWFDIYLSPIVST